MSRLLLLLLVLCCFICIVIVVFTTRCNKKIAVVFELNSRSGFFSVFFQLCHCYIYSKENSYDFYITHADWIYMYDKGWHDYFNSLTVWHDCYSSKYHKIKKYVSASCHHSIPKYSVKKYIDAIKEIFIIKPYLLYKAQSCVTQLKEYNSLYIRRGDKAIEMELLSINDILNYTDLQNSTSLFVQTDDYSIIDDVQECLPNCNVKTLCLKQNTGGSFPDSLNWTRQQRKIETENLLVEVLVFANAKHAWSDHRSNVGRFHKLYSYNNTMLYPPHVASYTMDTIINPGYYW